MANTQEKLDRMQEIADRGLQNKLSQKQKVIFDEAIARGLISLPTQTVKEQPTVEQPTIEQPTVEQPPINQAVPNPKEELLRSLSGTSIADVATDVVGAPVNQMLGGLASNVAGGYRMLGGLAEGALSDNPNALNDAIREGEETKQAVASSFEPETELGKKSSRVVFDALAQLNKIPAGWAGVAELIQSQDLESANEFIKSVEEKGLPRFMGDLNYEAYGSPLLATMTTALPEFAALFYPTKNAIIRGREDKARADLEIIDQIESGTAGRNLAEYKLKNRDKWSQPSKAEIDVLSRKLKVDKVFAAQLAETMPIVTKKKSGKKAVAQNWDKSLLGLVQSSSKADIKVMEKQLDIYDKARDNMVLKAEGRPIYEAGKAIGSRVNALVKERKAAGKRVGSAAEALRGVDVNYAPAVDKFVNSLVKDGVVINNGKPITNVRQYRNIDFRNSPYDGSKSSETLIRNQIKRMTEKDFSLDGFNIHTTKKNLPYAISTAKSSEGGLNPSGAVLKAEILLNELRTDLNNVLRDASPEYKSANDDFSSIMRPLEAFNDAMPKNAQINWDGINENNAGLQLRKILSNYANADNLYKAVQDVDTKTKRLGYDFNDDAIKQAFFAIGLDKRLGAFAEQSLQGVTEAGGRIADIPTDSVGIGMNILGKAMRKVKKVDDDSAIKSMREYLKESKQGKR